MKKLLIIVLIVPLFLTSCGKSEEVKTVVNPPVVEKPSSTGESPPVVTGSVVESNTGKVEETFTGVIPAGSVEGNSGAGNKSHLVTINIGEISFQVPGNYSVDKSQKDTLVSIGGIKQDGMNLFGLTVYEEKTPFVTFEDYFQDLEMNSIKRLIKENNMNLTDSAIDVELQKLKGHYSFKSKEMNGIKVVVHKRDFYGMIGKIYDMYVFLGNGKILHFASETDYPQIAEQIYSSLKK